MTKSLYKVSPSGEVGGGRGRAKGEKEGSRDRCRGEVGGEKEDGEGEADRDATRRRGECGGVEVEKKPTMGEREARSDSGGTMGERGGGWRCR